MPYPVIMTESATQTTIETDTTDIRVDSSTDDYRAERHLQMSNGEVTITHQDVTLAVEAAVAIVINDIHYAVLMASPYQLDYLAMGFLYSEGLIHQSSDLLDWEVLPLSADCVYEQLAGLRGEGGGILEPIQGQETLAGQLADYEVYMISLVVSQRCHQRILMQRRQLSGRTGCGMCGMTGLKQALPDLSEYHHPRQALAATPTLAALMELRAHMDTAQQAHLLTGAVHAAGTRHEGEYYLFEDVGRHNALDKLIGWQLRHRLALNHVVMTSRLSIELVQKAIRARLPWLIGMSAPTSTAVRIAQRYGLGVAGFLRDNRVTFYTPIDQSTEAVVPASDTDY